MINMGANLDSIATIFSDGITSGAAAAAAAVAVARASPVRAPKA